MPLSIPIRKSYGDVYYLLINVTKICDLILCWCAAAKFFWFLLFMFLTLLYFTYYGVACVAITPNLMMAAILSGAFYGLMNLFAGFVIPQPEFPGWWIWVSPTLSQSPVPSIQ